MIPPINLKKQHAYIKTSVEDAVLRVLESGRYLLGEETKRFESNFSSYIGTKYAVGVASGTDALMLSIQALGLKNEDEVIVPANVLPTAFAIASTRVKLILADIDPHTFNIDAQGIKNLITPKTKQSLPYIYTANHATWKLWMHWQKSIT